MEFWIKFTLTEHLEFGVLFTFWDQGKCRMIINIQDSLDAKQSIKPLTIWHWRYCSGYLLILLLFESLDIYVIYKLDGTGGDGV